MSMPAYHPPLDTPELLQWPEIRALDEIRWSGLLLGNGASIAVSDSFSYGSLFDVATVAEQEHHLGDGAAVLFAELETVNFEYVLHSLQIAARVCAAIAVDVPVLEELYNDVQEALFEAIAHVHIDWGDVAGRTLSEIRTELLQFRRVYTTNYDLLVYWAIMHEGDPDDFRDFFWAPAGAFDLATTEVWGRPTVVHYLHGGLQLRRTSNAGTYKRDAQLGNLLSQFRTDWTSGETPLLVSEGTADDKLRTINQSDYLSFVYERFAAHQGNLVIFGHGLSDQDEHLLRAMRQWDAPRQIAISIRTDRGDVGIRTEKARLAQQLPQGDLWFYDADSHPLGEPNLRAVPPTSGGARACPGSVDLYPKNALGQPTKDARPVPGQSTEFAGLSGLCRFL
jgi:hypothetical protein